MLDLTRLCKTVAIFLRPQCVKPWGHMYLVGTNPPNHTKLKTQNRCEFLRSKNKCIFVLATIHGFCRPLSQWQAVILWECDHTVRSGGTHWITGWPRQNGCHLADNIFKGIFFWENCWVSIQISLKFIPKGSSNNKLVLVESMTWCQADNKALSEAMMAQFTDTYESPGLNELICHSFLLSFFLTHSSCFYNIDGLVQDCSNSTANALELLQFCAKPSLYTVFLKCNFNTNSYICISYHTFYHILTRGK